MDRIAELPPDLPSADSPGAGFGHGWQRGEAWEVRIGCQGGAASALPRFGGSSTAARSDHLIDLDARADKDYVRRHSFSMRTRGDAMTNLEQQRDAWNRFAASYDEAITPLATRVAERALALAGVRAGDRLLDVAAGPGALSFPAARLGADVLAVDYSPAMVDLLELRAKERALSNLRARVMDGTALELDDGSFDIACSQLGIMLFPDRSAGLRELARVTRTGGTGVIVVFGPPDRVPFLSMFFEAVAAAVPGFATPPPRESPLFCLCDPGDVIREMSEAGFRDVRVEPLEDLMEIASTEHLWLTMQGSAPAVAGLLARLSEAEREASRRALADAFRARFGDGPAVLPVAFNVGIGHR